MNLPLLFLLVNLANPPASAGTHCSVDDLHTQVPPDVGAIALKNHDFSSGDYSAAVFLLENRSSKEIAHFTLALEYQTKEGDNPLSIVFGGSFAKQGLDQAIPAQYVQPLPNHFVPGRKERISGQSPYTLPGCPISARLTMLDIQYDDGSHYAWNSSGWWTEPLLSDYPDYLAIPDSKIWTSERYYFLAKVSPEGQLTEIRPSPPTREVPSDTVAESLKKLTFSPSLKDGKPHEAALILIVRFHRSGAERSVGKTVPEEPSIARTTALVDLSPRNSAGENWYFYYGGGRGYKTSRPSLREK